MAYLPFVAPGGQDLRPNVFSTVGGGSASQVVVSQYDLYRPNELLQVFERHTYGGGFRIMLKAMGFNRPTSAPTTGHYEYPWRENLVTIGAIITAAGGVANDIIIEMDAADMFAAGVTVNGVAGQQASYPVVHEILIFRDGEAAMIMDKDTTTNPAQHRLTLRPLDPLVNLDLSVLVGESYFVVGNAHAEGSDLPVGRVPRVISYTNDFQITKTKAQSTGTELTNTMYFQPVEGMAGSIYLKVKADMMYDFEKNCDAALIWGQNITNITEFVPSLGHDAPIRGTEGLITFATTNGNVDNYVAVGGYTLADFRDLARYYEGERVGTNTFMNLMGFELYQEVEQEMADFLNADTAALLVKDFLYGDSVFDNLDNTDYYKEPADLALKIGFKAIKIGGYNFLFRSFRDFNKRVGAGAAGYDYTSWQVVLPVGMATDKSTNTTRGTFGYEYKVSADGYSREEVIGEITGAGVGGRTIYRSASHGADIHECYMISEFAFHPTCANHVTIQRPQ
jgi:hypothetical protein